MLIRIDYVLCPLVVLSGEVQITAPDGRTLRADSLRNLVEVLQGSYDDVSLPENLFTEDLWALEDFVRLGFKHLGPVPVRLRSETIQFTPAGYWTTRDPNRGTEGGIAACRLYKASWQDPGRGNTVMILSEPELEALLSARQ